MYSNLKCLAFAEALEAKQSKPDKVLSLMVERLRGEDSKKRLKEKEGKEQTAEAPHGSHKVEGIMAN